MAKLFSTFWDDEHLVGKISRSNFFFQGPGRLSEIILPFVMVGIYSSPMDPMGMPLFVGNYIFENGKPL